MTAKTLKPYPKYKDSGVSWIGMVPQGWEVIALKHVCKVNAPVSHITKQYKADTMVTFLPMEKISIDGKIDCSQKERYIDVRTGYSSFAKDDVIIAKITPCFENGKGACLDVLDTEVGFGTTELINLRPCNKITSRFLFFITINKIFRLMGADEMTGSAGQKRVPAEFVKNYIIPLPPRPEQDAIVAYLDDKTAKIDRLIGLYMREIELLKERRQAVIHKAVTRGLNDKVKLKDSGVSWIGMVPQGWEVLPLKRFCFMKAGVNLVSTDINPNVGEYKVYGGNGLRGYYNNYNIDGDYLLVGRQGALCGNVHRVIGRIWATEHAVITRVNHKNNIGYVYYMLIAMNLNQYSNDTAAQPGLAVNVVLNLKTALPPRPEQDNIVAYLDDQCAKVDAMIGKVQSKIGLLEEYRVRLISDVVTGKVRV